jgi:hypothetical protein
MKVIEFEEQTCCNCGIVFQVPAEYQKQRRGDGQVFHCPNGHRQSYSESLGKALDKTKAENEELKVQIRQLKCRILSLEKPSWWKRIAQPQIES